MLTIIYYGNDPATAKAMAASLRAGGEKAMLRDATQFDGVTEKADRIIATPGCSGLERGRLVSAYGRLVEGDGMFRAADAAPEAEPVSAPRETPIMSDSELRAAILERTGKRPGPRMSRDKLIETFKAAGGI